ncbi:hypothetical protein GCM10022224_085820 [Nonomuraea antimicrobica]|uniref:Uncharacterized protein n=1 Tax=Nonomuraea antimicrobica TaxID=561173 RepID=A0ABP7DRQ6_9ACTN
MNARSSGPPAPRLAGLRSRRPADSAVVFERRDIGRSPATFSEYLDAGEHEQATPKGALGLPDSVAAGHAFLDLVESTLG